MKKVVLLFSALCMIAVTSCKEDATSKVDETNVAEAAVRDQAASKFPVIEFDKTDHDFGEIMDGTPVETVFNYTNTGESPLVITDVTSSCGCTIPKDWSREPLAPGESGMFTVKFNGKGNNKVSKAVTVTANTEKGREVVKISAFITPDPNKPAAANAAPRAIAPSPTTNALTTPAVKSSTQPGHEGHNHD